jgi:alkanesulfonate monooxygenase SsuD/methylene tetrahydromethanopterin reductase-like flavin-dependent oxidoreductase (luciferase family)
MQIDVLLEPDQTPQQLTALAQLCERAGIGTMWLQNYTLRRDPFMSLVPAALATTRVGLGVCVVSPWEMHPVKMANALLTLQEYAGGRAGLVIGGGGEWLARLGIKPQKRVRAVREAIELVRGACSGAPLTYKGELYKVWNYRAEFGIGVPPVVYAGANQSQMIRAATPAADGVMYSDMPRERIADAVGATVQAVSAKGRDTGRYRISNIWAWHIKTDREVAQREARRELLLRGLLDRWYLETFLAPEEYDIVERNKSAFYRAYRERSGLIEGVPDRIVEKLIGHLTFTATPAELERRLEELIAFRDAGINELCFRLHDQPDEAIRLIGERVIPRLS